MMEYLLEDLWVLIFLKLPVKTLLRCLAVCKSWQLFLQNPSFINAHLQLQRRDLMFVRHTPEDDKKKLDSPSSDDNEKATPECYHLHCDDESFTFYAKHEFPFCQPDGISYRVVGSCNGLICITDDMIFCRHQTYLWNPTIQKCIELPRPMFTFDKIGGFKQELGFGFDEKTNDYKVVRIVDIYDRPTCDASLKVEIYSLSSGIWRNTSHLASDLAVRLFGRDNQVYLNASIHWVCGKLIRGTYCFMVIAFHLSDEVFRCFEFPEDINHKFDPIIKPSPVVFQGFLSLTHYMDHKCSIWMMKDYGDSTSWAKHVDVNLSENVSRVIGLRRNGELIIEVLGRLCSYDPEATKGKEFNVLDEMDLHVWKLLQEGFQVFNSYWIVGPDKMFLPVRPCVYEYDPESAPYELGIRRNKDDSFEFSFHCESYVESLVLLGRVKSYQVESKTEESERRIHREDNNVAGLEAVLQTMVNVEGRQIAGNSVPL